MIRIPDLMLLNKGTDRKFELGGGFTTDPKYFQQTEEKTHFTLLSDGLLRLGPWAWSIPNSLKQVFLYLRKKNITNL